MLCQFTMKNYRCIKDTATLSMAAVDGVSEHRESLIEDRDGTSFLPLAAIYGPNGGGKSTVLDGLYGLCFKVMSPILAAIDGTMVVMGPDSLRHLIVPYLFDEEARRSPTEYSLVFRTAGYEYEYNLSVLKDEVVSESLYRKSIVHGRYTRVFSREAGGQISLTMSLRRGLPKDRLSILPSLPLLSYLGIVSGEHQVVADVISWFRRGVHFLDYKDSFREHYMNLPEDGEMKRRILHFLDAMDTNIVDYRLEEVKDPSGNMRLVHIYTRHEVRGRSYELELPQESSGTIKVFNSLPMIISALMDGSALVVDELDAKLHPALLQFIIRLFSDRSINRSGAQLIFASQDIMTMNSINFRRDEIWFVAKNGDEEAQVYALSDFRGECGEKPRKDASYSKQYMEGRYGADPFFKQIADWGE